MQLSVLETSPTSLRAGYSCPCGCSPAVEYRRGEGSVEEGCCCGNDFAVGPNASASLAPRTGFEAQRQTFAAPWGEPLEAAWLVGPSTHDREHGHEHGAPAAGSIDPVCGMTVQPETARANGLHSEYKGTDYFFCGKGCKLDFDEDPERYLDPRHVPSM